MKKRELLERIEQLEARIADLEARIAAMPYVVPYAPQPPYTITFDAPHTGTQTVWPEYVRSTTDKARQ